MFYTEEPKRKDFESDSEFKDALDMFKRALKFYKSQTEDGDFSKAMQIKNGKFMKS